MSESTSSPGNTMTTPPNITLYTGQSPNGIKISITLAELALPYTVRKIDMTINEQKSAWFIAINPNGRIPALTDFHSDDNEIRLFESGSIMQYLVDKYDTNHKISYPRGSREAVETTNWLFFQNAGVGPMQGQANHFVRYAGEELPYAKARYQDELRRLYSVLNKHLSETGFAYLVGEKCTIADIAHWGWITLCRWAGVELSEFPALEKWEQRMFDRPGVQEGRQVPDGGHQRELLRDPEKMAAFEERGRAFYRKQAEDGMKTKQGV